MNASFADIAVALKLQANELAARVDHCERTAHDIKLSRLSADLAIAECRTQADLVKLAHEIIKGLIPVEAAVRSLINDIGER
jgi:hypothetical protein